jgi:Raf kinase inhibitor-like YbhB/YbcL family protein
MSTFWRLFLAAMVVSPALLNPGTHAWGAERTAFELTSADLKRNESISEPFVFNDTGCTGGNISPALEWRGAPPGTKSFAITMFDPDERGTPSGWWHWVVYDIPSHTTHLAQGAGGTKDAGLPAGALRGINDGSVVTYQGPCPDAGNPPHHYTLTIYALKTAKLPVPAQASGAMVTYTVHEFTLAKASLIALYGRPAPQKSGSGSSIKDSSDSSAASSSAASTSK